MAGGAFSWNLLYHFMVECSLASFCMLKLLEYGQMPYYIDAILAMLVGMVSTVLVAMLEKKTVEKWCFAFSKKIMKVALKEKFCK